MIQPEAYPLEWPWWWPRTKPHMRRHGKTAAPFLHTLERLRSELSLGKARSIVVSTNVPLKRDNEPMQLYREPADPGVALWFTTSGGVSRVIPCDHWRTTRDNIESVLLAYTHLRQLERLPPQLVEAALGSFSAHPEVHYTPSGVLELPQPAPWHRILGIELPTTRRKIAAHFRQLQATMHPDRGGDQDAFSTITAAYHQALKETPE